MKLVLRDDIVLNQVAIYQGATLVGKFHERKISKNILIPMDRKSLEATWEATMSIHLGVPYSFERMDQFHL